MIYVCSITRHRAWQKNVRYLVYSYICLCIDICVFMEIWCREEWQKDCREILEKDQFKISVGSTGNHGDWDMVFVNRLVLLVFCDHYIWFGHGHVILFVVSYCYWFSWFSSCLFLLFPFMFWDSWLLVGKAKI